MPLIGPFDTEAEALAECSPSYTSSDSSDDTDRVWCGCHDMPDSLTMTVSGDCEFANGTYVMTARPGIGGYSYDNPAANPGVVSAGTGTTGCGWHVEVRCPAGVGFATALGFLTKDSCKPFHATSSSTLEFKGQCCQGATINVTISA